MLLNITYVFICHLLIFLGDSFLLETLSTFGLDTVTILLLYQFYYNFILENLHIPQNKSRDKNKSTKERKKIQGRFYFISWILDKSKEFKHKDMDGLQRNRIPIPVALRELRVQGKLLFQALCNLLVLLKYIGFLSDFYKLFLYA